MQKIYCTDTSNIMLTTVTIFFSAKAYTFTNSRSSSITAIQAVILLEYSHTSEVYLHWCCSIFYPGSLNQTISKDIKMYAIQP